MNTDKCSKERVATNIRGLVKVPLAAELKDMEKLEERYAQTVDEMDEEIAVAEKELEAMQAELVVGEGRKVYMNRKIRCSCLSP